MRHVRHVINASISAIKHRWIGHRHHGDGLSHGPMGHASQGNFVLGTTFPSLLALMAVNRWVLSVRELTISLCAKLIIGSMPEVILHWVASFGQDLHNLGWFIMNSIGASHVRRYLCYIKRWIHRRNLATQLLSTYLSAFLLGLLGELANSQCRGQIEITTALVLWLGSRLIRIARGGPRTTVLLRLA